MPNVIFSEQSSATVKVRGRDQATAIPASAGVGPQAFPPPPPPVPPPLVASVLPLGFDPTSAFDMAFDRPPLTLQVIPGWTIQEQPALNIVSIFVSIDPGGDSHITINWTGVVNPGEHLLIPAGESTFRGIDGGLLAEQSIVLVQ